MTTLRVLQVPGCPNAAVLAERLGRLLGDPELIEYRVVGDQTEAEATGMTGSPTLLIDGVDPFAPVDGLPSLSCRLYRDETGAAVGAPSVTQLRTALADGGVPVS